MFCSKMLKIALFFVILNAISVSANSITRENIDTTSEVNKSKKGFFGSLAALEGFESDDVLEMFRNAGAVEKPGKAGDCGGECRTPIAFWMLQPLLPCASIIKGDCPTGLVCCERIKDDEDVSSNDKLRSSTSGDTSDQFFIPEEDIEFIRSLANAD